MTKTAIIRRCTHDDHAEILAIVNDAAEVYRGVIPVDRWHEPYMSATELAADVAAGVEFWGHQLDGSLAGVMGIQRVDDVALIRHAYVRPVAQRTGSGAALIDRIRGQTERPLFVGTWAAATWAIRFYERNGFTLVPPAATPTLLRRYWSIPERQIETSVVLADPAL